MWKNLKAFTYILGLLFAMPWVSDERWASMIEKAHKLTGVTNNNGSN